MARPAIHPGRMIASEMETLNLSVPELAEILPLAVSRINEILEARAPITQDVAIKLDNWLHNGADFWLDLQKEYEYRKALLASAEAERTERNRQLGLQKLGFRSKSSGSR